MVIAYDDLDKSPNVPEQEAPVEQFPPDIDQLKLGYLLGKEESVPIQFGDIDKSKMVSQSVTLGKERRLTYPGMKTVAEIRVGAKDHFGDFDNQGNYERATVYETQDGIYVVSIDGTDAYSEIRDGSFTIGREMPGQEDISDTISRAHCEISMIPGSKDAIVVKNLDPTNDTFIRTFGQPRRSVA